MLRVLRWGDCLGLSQAIKITRVLKGGRGKQQSQCQRERRDSENRDGTGYVRMGAEVSEGFEDSVLLALKMEEGVISQGMQVASRN